MAESADAPPTITMKAAVCRRFGEELQIEEVTLRAPGPGEIRVRLGACAICHSDIHFADGAWGGTLPAIYGHEAAGTVVETGRGVEAFTKGDRVVATLIRSCGACPACRDGHEVVCEAQFALDEDSPLRDANGQSLEQGMRIGAFAEEVTIHASQAVGIPGDLPFAEASLLACGVLTGVGAVTNTADVPAGSSAVIIGAGGVGLNAVQGARLRHAKPIIAIDLEPSKLDLARALGASHIVRADASDVAAEVRAACGGRLADFVFVTVGAGSALAQGNELLAPGGTLVLVGMPPSDVRHEIDPGTMASREQRILGSKMGSAQIRRDIPALVAQHAAGSVELAGLVSGRYPLEKINEAMAAVRRGHAIRNVIEFDDSDEGESR